MQKYCLIVNNAKCNNIPVNNNVFVQSVTGTDVQTGVDAFFFTKRVSF